jgi:hypothetical protein
MSERTVGQEFRGAVQTAAVRYLAGRADHAVGYIDCGVFDRWAVYDGSDPDAPVISLRAAGFRLHTPRPDFEDMLYYLLDR